MSPRPRTDLQKKRANYRRKWHIYQQRQRMKRRDEFNALLIKCFPPRTA
jgi:hypothetical protein